MPNISATAPLFQADSFTSSPIEGLRVRLQRACRCGSNLLVTGSGKGTHAASLTCANCSRHAGWLSSESVAFLHGVIERFGRPTHPIEVRQ
jgi:hypothetical protein